MCVKKCGNKSSNFKYVEEKLLQGLRDWLEKYESEYNSESQEPSTLSYTYNRNLESLQKELKELSGQKNKLHNLLERGVYDIDTFLDKSKI
jgi:site-specific DNA recombinase